MSWNGTKDTPRGYCRRCNKFMKDNGGWQQYLCPRGFLFAPNGVHAKVGTRGHDHGDNCYIKPWDVMINIEWNVDPTLFWSPNRPNLPKIHGSQIARYYNPELSRMFSSVKGSNEYVFFNFTKPQGSKLVNSFFHFWQKYNGEVKPQWPKYHWYYGMLIFRGWDMLKAPKGYDKYAFPPLMYDTANDCFKGGSKPASTPIGIQLCPGAYSSSSSGSTSSSTG